jgi:hypothetical protein
MIIDIVSCGQSASNWEQHDYSIGVNDCWKFGKPTDALLICNRPEQFIRDRFQTIINSKPKEFYSHKANWSQWFPNWKKVNLVPWYGTLHKGQIYESQTGPFIAMSLAYKLGATDIILWGVDFKNHWLFNDSNPETAKEVKVYLELIECLKQQGVNMWIGAVGSVFENLIQLYDEH